MLVEHCEEVHWSARVGRRVEGGEEERVPWLGMLKRRDGGEAGWVGWVGVSGFGCLVHLSFLFHWYCLGLLGLYRIALVLCWLGWRKGN